MKRIIICLLVCFLLAACKTPDAVVAKTAFSAEKTETDAAPEETAALPDTDESAVRAKERSEEPKHPDPGEALPEDEPDTDVVKTAETTASAPLEKHPWADARFPGKFSESPEYGERSYKSKSIDVTITTYRVEETYSKLTTYHVADIYVKDVTSIRTAAAHSFDTRYERTVREIAADAGALLAIDGDTYTRAANSFVIRNGELYRSTPIEDTDICILYRDGRMETRKWGAFTMDEVVASDPWQVWGFGPALLDENGHSMEIENKLSPWNPRAAIGYYEPGHYCFVIVDGREKGWSEGVRLSALSRLMEDLGCKAAYNLDGGDSAQMYWNGEIISKSRNESRVISDIIYILPEE